MFKRFAQLCDWVGPRHESGPEHEKDAQEQESHHTNLNRRTALAAATLLLAPLAQADVGLPEFAGPDFLRRVVQPAVQEETQARVTIKAISHQQGAEKALAQSCTEAARRQEIALDFAPPADTRTDASAGDQATQSEAGIPLLIEGGSAVMKTGQAISSLEAVTIEGRTILVSKDRDYFNQLQNIRPRDKLLVQTAESLRQYEVTAARVAQAGEGLQAPHSLTLVSCYPFQPLGQASLLYTVNAQPWPANPEFVADGQIEEVGYTTVSF